MSPTSLLQHTSVLPLQSLSNLWSCVLLDSCSSLFSIWEHRGDPTGRLLGELAEAKNRKNVISSIGAHVGDSTKLGSKCSRILDAEKAYGAAQKVTAVV